MAGMWQRTSLSWEKALCFLDILLTSEGMEKKTRFLSIRGHPHAHMQNLLSASQRGTDHFNLSEVLKLTDFILCKTGSCKYPAIFLIAAV